MRPGISIVVVLVLLVPLVAQSGVPRVPPHPLIEIDVPVTPDKAWEALDDRPHCSLAPLETAFERHRVPNISDERRSWSGVAWRGERIHAQVLVWSKKPLSQLRMEPAPLVAPAGGTIPATAMRIRFVRYVLSELPPGSRKTHCDVIDQQTSHLVPDLLDPAARFDLPAATTRPVWITIDVPRDANPGVYKGGVRLKAEDGLDQALTLELEVQPGVVPAPADWAFRVDFWQNPWAVAYQHRLVPWSAAHLAVLRAHLSLLADMGQTYVSAYITHSPWNDDTFVPDATMVEWIRQPDGSFTFDYRILDTYLELAMASGINDAISLFTMVPWDGRVRYLDRATGKYSWSKWATNSPDYAKFWKGFLADLRKHLVERGWFKKTYLEVNERSLGDTLRALDVARLDSPDWKLTYAGGYHAEFAQPIDDLCTVINAETPAAVLEARRKRGQTSTFYVACEPPFPNDFPFSPPAENVWMGWHAAARGMDGFLRWAWDNWPADPIRDSRHFRFPAGDTFLVYPGPLASVRMELLREGFVDFEKIRAVRKRVADGGSPVARQAIAQLDKAIERFSWEHVQSSNGATVDQDVREAREALAAATRAAF